MKVLERTGPAPIVMLEPSCAAALHKDLPELIPTEAAGRVAARITTFGAAVEARLDHGWRPPPLPEQLMLQQHCHERYSGRGRLADVEAELAPVGMQAFGLSSIETAEPRSAEPRVPIRLGHITTAAFGSPTRSR